MEVALESSVIGRSTFISVLKSPFFVVRNRHTRLPVMISPRNYRYPCQFAMNCSGPYIFRNILNSRFHVKDEVFDERVGSRFRVKDSENWSVANAVSRSNLEGFRVLVKCGFVLAAMVCGVLVFGCRRVLAVEGVVNAGYGVFGQSILLLRNAWPKVSQVLRVFKEQGLILVALLSLSAFFSMAETSITTLWPWKELVRQQYVFRRPAYDLIYADHSINLVLLCYKIISVERMLQYTCIRSEPPLVTEANQPDHSWPSNGEVDNRDLQIISSLVY